MTLLCVSCNDRCKTAEKLRIFRSRGWSRLSSDHRVSQVAAQGDRCPCLQVVQVVHIPVDAASHGPDCCRTKEIPQFIDTVAGFLLCSSCRFSGAAVEKTFVLPQLQLAEKIVVSSLSWCRGGFPWSRLKCGPWYFPSCSSLTR